MNKKILSMVLLVALALTLTACSGDNANKEVNTTASNAVNVADAHLGTYEGKIDVPGMEDAMSQLEGVEGVDTAALNTVSITLEKDGKFTMNMAGAEVEGTYTLDGSKLSMTYSGMTQEATWENSQITMEDSGVKIVLTKK